MTSKPQLTLHPTHPEQVVIYSNPNDLRRDLHTFVAYVKGRTIKRTYRGNDLPQADFKRLAQVIPGGELRLGEETALDDGAFPRYSVQAPSWIDFLDRIALNMNFTNYKTQGVYRGYSSAEPSYPDNVMRFKADAYQAFLALPLAIQERRLLDALVNSTDFRSNEFCVASTRGRLDRFSSFGSATGVMPLLNFAAARRFLLELLLECEPNTWYGTAELVAYLKASHPFFLIPKKPEMDKHTRLAPSRYGNFVEAENAMSFPRAPIPDDAADGFERVEGRYVERFLEGMLLTLGYVDVAYADQAPQGPLPSYGHLQAFRLNTRLRQTLRGEIPQPKVTVQPNFEIYVESAFYPALLLTQLAPFTEIIREDTTTILRLRKQKVAAQLAEQPDLDLIALLTELTGQALPQNVAIELGEWAGHAGVFTLFDGFGLVETLDHHALVEQRAVEKIGGTVRLVRDPGALSDRLMQTGAVALRIHHGDATWTEVPAGVPTLLPQSAPAAEKPKKKAKREVTLKREALVALHFADDDLFEVFSKALVDARCVLEVNKETRTLTVSKKDEARIDEAIKRCGDEYAIRLEDLE